MNTVTFDEAFDTSGSEVIANAYWDAEKQYLYLVFHSGTTVTRYLPNETAESLREVSSWGGFWNSTVRFADNPQLLVGGVEFVQRTPVTTNDATDLGHENVSAESDEQAAPFVTVSVDFDSERLSALLSDVADVVEAAQDTAVGTISHVGDVVAAGADALADSVSGFLGDLRSRLGGKN